MATTKTAPVVLAAKAEEAALKAVEKAKREADAVIRAEKAHEEAVIAQEEGADYVGFGPVFPTRSKANPASVKGLKALSEVCAALTIPVIAIAGVTVDRVEAILDSGAHGVAVMTAVTNAADPQSACAAIREKVEKHAF